MISSPLTNYLRTHRKRLALSQDEVAFLLGFRGGSKGSKVCRDEQFTREPSLTTALAYEAIYQRPVRELFAGLYQKTEQEVAERAKVLTYRKVPKPNRQTACKSQVLAGLAARQSKPPRHPSQS